MSFLLCRSNPPISFKGLFHSLAIGRGELDMMDGKAAAISPEDWPITARQAPNPPRLCINLLELAA